MVLPSRHSYFKPLNGINHYKSSLFWEIADSEETIKAQTLVRAALEKIEKQYSDYAEF